MANYKVGVGFETNVGVLSRDMAQGAQVVRVFGTEAASGLKAATVASDEYSLAAQRVAAADARLTAARERLLTVQAAGTASTREMAAAQTAFVTSQERLLAAQTAQARISTEARATAAVAPSHVNAGGLIAGLAATTLALKVKDAVEEGAKSAAGLQAINRQVEVSLASTGNVADTSAEHIDHVASSIAHYSGISDQAVVAGQLLELTFTGIRNEGSGANAIFDRGAKVAADMAIGLHLARGGAIDYQGSMQLLARALNDPVSGMQQLRRAGVAFTADQRAQITELAKSGHMLQAQGMILDLVSQKYGAAAKTFGEGADGGFARARVAVEEFDRALASPVLAGGLPILHALTATLQFLTDHPIALGMGEATIGIIGAAFALATLERAMRFLRESEWVSALGRWAFGYRSLGRTITTVAAEEDAHAAAAGRSAEAENLNAAAMERAAMAARSLAVAQGEADAASAGAAAGGWRGLLRRVGLGGGGAAATGGLAAPVAIAGAAVLGGAATLLAVRNTSRREHAESVVQQLLGAQATTPGGYADPRFANTIQSLQTSHGPLGVFGASDKAFRDASQLLIEVRAHYTQYGETVQSFQSTLDDAVNSHGAMTRAMIEEKDATYIADLAYASGVQKRADAAAKAYKDALTFQHQVAAGNADAVKQIEQTIGVGAAGLFDAVPATSKAATPSQVTSLHSAQVGSSSAADRISLAEGRLEKLRGSHKTTALQLQAAEDSLRQARERASIADERLGNAEQKIHDATKSTALTVGQVLTRALDQVGAQQGTADAARRLVRLGVSQPVLQQLLALDSTAPGTFASVAAHITAAGAHQLNRDERLKEAARRQLEVAFSAANTKSARHAAAQSASLAAEAWQQAYLAAIRDPKFWELVNTDLGRLLVGNLGVLPKGDAPGTGSTRAPSTSLFPGLKSSLPTTVNEWLYPGIGQHSVRVAAPNVVVHVHTVAPRNIKNETNVNVAHMTASDVQALAARGRRAVWN